MLSEGILHVLVTVWWLEDVIIINVKFVPTSNVVAKVGWGGM